MQFKGFLFFRDVVFENTYVRFKKDGSYHYRIEEVIGLYKNEQFTEVAEGVILVEILKTSLMRLQE